MPPPGDAAREGSPPPAARQRRWPRRSSRPRRSRTCPRSRPATAGPATWPTWKRSCQSALALANIGRPTKVAITAVRVGLSTLTIPDPSARQRVQRPERSVPTSRVQRETDAAGRERQLRDHEQSPPVDRVRDRASEQRAGEHWNDLHQAHKAHVQRRVGQQEHLVWDRDHRELRTERRDQVAQPRCAGRPATGAAARGRQGAFPAPCPRSYRGSRPPRTDRVTGATLSVLTWR